MDISVLENVGLTNGEIKAYLSLLELGPSKAGAVIKHSGLQNSVAHMSLGKLVEKGLAAFTRNENIRVYRATDPRNLVRWIEEKKKNVETLIPNLLAHQAPHVSQEAEVFEGMRGFKAMAYNFIEGAEPGDDYLFFSFITKAGLYDDEVFTFYRGFTIDRQRRGLTIKGISHVCQRGRFLAQGYNPASVCFVEFPTLQNVSICRNKVIFTPWDDKQVSFMVTSKQLADNYRDYFYSVWNFRSPRADAA